MLSRVTSQKPSARKLQSTSLIVLRLEICRRNASKDMQIRLQMIFRLMRSNIGQILYLTRTNHGLKMSTSRCGSIAASWGSSVQQADARMFTKIGQRRKATQTMSRWLRCAHSGWWNKDSPRSDLTTKSNWLKTLKLWSGSSQQLSVMNKASANQSIDELTICRTYKYRTLMWLGYVRCLGNHGRMIFSHPSEQS